MTPFFDRWIGGNGALGRNLHERLSRQRSENQLMTTNDCIDLRAWSSIPLDCVKYFQEKNERKYYLGKIVPQSAVMENILEFKAAEVFSLKEEIKRYKSLITNLEKQLQSQRRHNVIMEFDEREDRKRNYKMDEVTYINRSVSPFSRENLNNHRSASDVDLSLHDVSVQTDLINNAQPTGEEEMTMRHFKSQSQCSECDSSSECNSHSFICSESESVKKKYDTLKDHCIQQESKILSLQCQLNVKDKDIEELTLQIDKLRLALENVQYSRIGLQEKMQEMNEQNLKEIQELKDEFQYQLSIQDERLKYYKNQVEELMRKTDELNCENEKIQVKALERINHLQYENEQLRRDSKQLQEQEEENDRLVNALHSIEEKYNDEIHSLRKEVKTLTTKLKEIKRRNKFVLNSIVDDKDSSKLPVMMMISNPYNGNLSSEEDDSTEPKKAKTHNEKHSTLSGRNWQVIKDSDNTDLVHSDMDEDTDDESILQIVQNDDGLNYVKVLKDGQHSGDEHFGDYKRDGEDKITIEIKNGVFKQLLPLLASEKVMSQLLNSRLINNVSSQDSENTYKLLSSIEEYKAENKELMSQLKEKDEQVQKLQEELNHRTAELVQTSAQVSQISEMKADLIDQKEREIEELKEKLAHYSAKLDVNADFETVDRLRDELQRATTFLNKQQEDQQILEDNIRLWKTELEGKNVELQNNVHQVNLEKECLQKELDVAFTKIEDLTTKLNLFADVQINVRDLQNKLPLLQHENETLRNDLHQKDLQIEQYEKKLREIVQKQSEVVQIDISDVGQWKSEIELRDNKINELEKKVEELTLSTEELKVEQDAADHLMVVCNELSKLCEEKWNLEMQSKSLRSQLKNCFSKNRKLESKFENVKSDNEALKMRIMHVKTIMEKLSDEFFVDKMLDEPRLSDKFDRLFQNVALLKERFQAGNVEHLEAKGNATEKDSDITQSTKQPKQKQSKNSKEFSQKDASKEDIINFREETLFNTLKSRIEHLTEENCKLYEELQIRENREKQYNERLKSVQKKYDAQMQSLREDHSNIINYLIESHVSHEKNAKIASSKRK